MFKFLKDFLFEENEMPVSVLQAGISDPKVDLGAGEETPAGAMGIDKKANFWDSAGPTPEPTPLKSLDITSPVIAEKTEVMLDLGGTPSSIEPLSFVEPNTDLGTGIDISGKLDPNPELAPKLDTPAEIINFPTAEELAETPLEILTDESKAVVTVIEPTPAMAQEPKAEEVPVMEMHEEPSQQREEPKPEAPIASEPTKDTEEEILRAAEVKIAEQKQDNLKNIEKLERDAEAMQAQFKKDAAAIAAKIAAHQAHLVHLEQVAPEIEKAKAGLDMIKKEQEGLREEQENLRNKITSIAEDARKAINPTPSDSKFNVVESTDRVAA